MPESPQFSTPYLFWMVFLAALLISFLQTFGRQGILLFLYTLFAGPLFTCILNRPVSFWGLRIRQYNSIELAVFAVVLIQLQIIVFFTW